MLVSGVAVGIISTGAVSSVLAGLVVVELRGF